MVRLVAAVLFGVASVAATASAQTSPPPAAGTAGVAPAATTQVPGGRC